MNAIITRPSLEEVRTWFEQSHVTITFTTESGSHYTLVSRPRVIVLINDDSGTVSIGRRIKVTPARVAAQGASIQMWTRNGYTWTTGIVSFYVLSN